MTDRPYTDEDLRAEAARQHLVLTEDPDFMGVGEAMEDRYVESTFVDGDEDEPDGETGSTWGELLPYNHDDGNAYNAAQRAIHDLINGAADVSEWAIQLGAAGLTPHPAMAWQSTTGGYDVAVQVATTRMLTDDARDELITEIRKAVSETVCRVLGHKPVSEAGR